jgi:membrane protease YdiL (CAAX protease family)
MITAYRQPKFLAASLLTIYVLLRYVFPQTLDQFGQYATYAFEVIFCANAVYIFRGQLTLRISYRKEMIWHGLATLVAGFAIFSLAAPVGLSVPFNLRDLELIFLLVIFGPILEEFIFRFAFWHALSELLTPKLVLPLTTLIFSYSHFAAYFLVPEDFKGFVLYQSSYTRLLGWWLGNRYRKYGSLGVTILYHMLFNLGFLLGFFWQFS